VVPKETFHSIAKVSGVMITVYFLARVIDVGLMASKWTPLFDRSFTGMMGGYYGYWMLAVEFILLIAAISMLLVKKNREKEKTFLIGICSAAGALFLNKMFVVLNGSSVPNFPWKSFAAYNPTIQEWFIFLGGLSVMVLIYMWFAKYTPLFPHAAGHGHDDKEHAAE